MKSIWYSVPPEYMPMHPFADEMRVRVFYEGKDIHSLQIPADMILMGVNWFGIYKDIQAIVYEEWSACLASVDIIPGDGCPHSDEMIPE